MNNKADEIKKQALKQAEYLHKQAQEKGDANLFDKAAEYYYTAGKTALANECWDAADRLRAA